MDRSCSQVFWSYVIVSLLSLTMLLAAPSVKAEEMATDEESGAELLSFDFSVDFLSQYVWRGYALSNNSLVIQPSMTVNYKGFSANIWGNFDTDEDDDFGSQKHANWNETDFTLSYKLEFYKGISATVGGIYYALDSADDSFEVFGGLSADLPWFTLGVTIYRDVWNYLSWWFQGDISRSFDLPFLEASLDLATGLIYQLSIDEDAYPDPDDPTDPYSAFHTGYISVALNIPVHKHITLSAKFGYWFPLGDDASNAIKSISWDKRSHHVYGGLNATMSF